MTDTFGTVRQSIAEEGGHFELAINALSWPHTERLEYPVGEEIRWRWINGSGFEHPMHLHGSHFRTRARGDGRAESRVPSESVQEVVTEFMEPGSTFQMSWTPTRPGNWLMHCHIRDHIIPDPPRPEEQRLHDLHDVRLHALEAMAGLVMGIVVRDEGGDAAAILTDEHLRLAVRERVEEGSVSHRGGGRPCKC